MKQAMRSGAMRLLKEAMALVEATHAENPDCAEICLRVQALKDWARHEDCIVTALLKEGEL